jgi:hypothetical protein
MALSRTQEWENIAGRARIKHGLVGKPRVGGSKPLVYRGWGATAAGKSLGLGTTVL